MGHCAEQFAPYVLVAEQPARCAWFAGECVNLLEEFERRADASKNGGDDLVAAAGAAAAESVHVMAELKRLFGNETVASGVMADVEALANEARIGDAARMSDMIEASWASVWEGMPAYCRSNEKVSMQKWFALECLTLVERFFANCTASDKVMDSRAFWESVEEVQLTDRLPKGEIQELEALATGV